MTVDELLKTYVILYNYGVEAGDFDPLLELFDKNAVLEFEDEKIGRFEGKDSIGNMFRLQMPSNKIELTNVEEQPDSISADY